MKGVLSTLLNFAVAYAALVKQTAEELIKHQTAEGHKHVLQFDRVLDLNCSVGRRTFELAKTFRKVVGLDSSTRFIRIGTHLLSTGKARYTLPTEGVLESYRKIALADIDVTELQKERVEFVQGDACNLDRKKLSHFDCVVLSGLTLLYSPDVLLTDIHTRINPGGLLVIATTCDWMEKYTPKTSWVGGIKEDGESVTTIDALERLLRPHFVCFKSIVQGESGESSVDLPYLIRKTSRTFDLGIANVSAWMRKDDAAV